MFIKLLVLLLALHSGLADARGLRKKPKVYNALITTDENLTSSRAYPVIQPTIHESGYAHAPFGPFNPYTLLSPPLVRFGQPIVPGLEANERLPYPLPPTQLTPEYTQYPTSSESKPPTAPAERAPIESDVLPPPELTEVTNAKRPRPPANTEPIAKEMPKEQLPIPLNEYGLPPVLIPLPSQQQPLPYSQEQQQQQQHFNLPPYTFNQYPPLFYNQLQRARDQLLPPYDYYPNHAYAVSGARPQQPSSAAVPTAVTPSEERRDEQSTNAVGESMPELRTLVTEARAPSFEDIRNGAESKNSDVPDVPPPPIPSGPKRPSLDNA